MKKPPIVLFTFVFFVLCTFSAYSVDMSIDAPKIQSTSRVKANVCINSDGGVLSGRFFVSYDSSVATLRDISSPDFIFEKAETDVGVDVVFVSKSGVEINSGIIKLEFERLRDGEIVLSIDSATFVDNAKKVLSADSVSAKIILKEKSVDISTQDENFVENASADSLVLKGDLRKRWKPIILFLFALIMVALIVFVKINKEKNCADSK